MKTFKWHLPIIVLALSVMVQSGFCYNTMKFDIHSEHSSSQWNLNHALAGFHYAVNKAYAEVRVTIPLPGSTPTPYTTSGFTNSTGYLTPSSTEESQEFTSEVSIGVPFLDGLAFLDYAENLGLSYNSFIENASLHLDTTLSGNGAINLLANQSSNLVINQNWKTIRFGYILKPKEHAHIGFSLNKHWFTLYADADYYGSASGALTKFNSFGSTQYQLNYDINSYSGQAHADYAGSGWSPELSLKYYMVRLEAKLGADFNLKGSGNLSHTTPYFIDALSLNPTYSKVQDLLDASSLDKASGHQVNTGSHSTTSDIRFKTPSYYTFEVEVIDTTLYISYTKTMGSYSLIAERDSLDSASPYDARRFFEFSTTIDHIAIVQGYFKYGYVVTGMFFLTTEENPAVDKFITYYQENNLFKDFTTTVFSPILYGGVLIGTTAQFELQIHAFPIPKLKMGVRYEF